REAIDRGRDDLLPRHAAQVAMDAASCEHFSQTDRRRAMLELGQRYLVALRPVDQPHAVEPVLLVEQHRRQAAVADPAVHMRLRDLEQRGSLLDRYLHFSAACQDSWGLG